MNTTRVICAYEPCSKPFIPTHPRQRFCEPTCRSNQWYVDNPGNGRELVDGALRSVATHPLQEVRDQQATKKHNRDLAGLIRKAIVNQIQITGECAPEDLIPLYPEGEVDECRRLATAQFGAMASNGDGTAPLIREKERRKSSIPSRKGAKVSVWEFTKAGWDKWGTAGVGAGIQERVSARLPGDSNGVACSPAPSVDPGGTSSPPEKDRDNGSPETAAQAPPASGEPAVPLFEDTTPSAYDPWEDAA